MKFLLWLVVLGGAGTGVLAYLGQEVPGGEKRYEQFIRQVKDRHPDIIPGPQISLDR
jgi:hypothetical protein